MLSPLWSTWWVLETEKCSCSCMRLRGKCYPANVRTQSLWSTLGIGLKTGPRVPIQAPSLTWVVTLDKLLDILGLRFFFQCKKRWLLWELWNLSCCAPALAQFAKFLDAKKPRSLARRSPNISGGWLTYSWTHSTDIYSSPTLLNPFPRPWVSEWWFLNNSGLP